MENSTKIGRSGFLGRMAALGMTTLTGLPPLFANGDKSASKTAGDTADEAWANINNIVIRDGYVISMDKLIGDLPQADVHINNGKIINIAKNIKAEGATEINGKGMIVMPGIVETHWHVWTSVLRALAGSKPGIGYFDIIPSFGKHFTPEDTYLSTRLALSEAVYSGITFVHDWCHNVRSQQHAEASLRAIKDAGVGARFSVGLPAGADDNTSIDLEVLTYLKKNWAGYSADNLVSLGLAWGGPGNASPIRIKELETARKLAVPISVHAGRKADGEDSISKLAGFLGADMQVVHGIKTTAEELKLMADAGTSLSISPYSELRIGYGFPPVPEILTAGINVGLSVDTFPLSGNADLFAVMKIFLNLANGMSKNEFIVTGKRILEIATIEGARSMGIDHLTGSLTPGKRADIIMVDTKAPNMWPLTDPVQLIVTAAQPANVDTVIINGKVVKRSGKLPGTDREEILLKSSHSLDKLKKQTEW